MARLKTLHETALIFLIDLLYCAEDCGKILMGAAVAKDRKQKSNRQSKV